MEQKYDNNLKGALWKKTSKNTGKDYLGGSVEINGQKYWISVFKKDKPEGSNQPDYDVMLKPDIQQDDISQPSNEIMY